MWGWRRVTLRLFGAEIGRGAHIHSSVKIAVPWNLKIGKNTAIGDGVILYSLGVINIGDNTTISQFAHLCAGSHDHNVESMPLLKQPIDIGSGCWICAEAFVGPGVKIAEQTIVGARAVVMKDVGAQLVVAGNPAKIVNKRS